MDDHGRGPAAMSLLGGFELRQGRGPVSVALNAQRLLAFLALTARPVHRSFVAGSLWPDTSEVKAAANLRTALWRVQRLADDGDAAPLVDATSSHLSLHPRVDVDVRGVEELAGRLLRDTAVDTASVDVWSLSKPLLPDFWDDWITIERERVRHLCLESLELICVRSSSQGLHAQAVFAAMAAVSAEPLRETANAALIDAHLAAGNRSEALRHYERYRTLLRAELGVEPAWAPLVLQAAR